ncbi:phage tail protein [Acinetobacter sp. TGL-Y2]|uniref:phage tail protein n=1 Tax=Acinetobacter sp. TGL-Y2 TaxID=1407071 RepID=UPI001907498A|nr:phage tail protein [Acinetobacter sp. TGL-Y2]MBJ9370560.1 phage tail protein [Acinetobacter sp. TGL-Y2]
MNKPISLRDYLIKSIRFLQLNPDKLTMFIESGRYRSTLATGYSMESICPVKLIIQNFSGDPDVVAFLLFQWLRTHQSELMANLEKNKTAVKFEAEILQNDEYDIMFEVELTERVIIQKQADGSFNFTYPEEPQYLPAKPSTACQLIDQDGQTLATWQSADPENSVALVMPLPRKDKNAE